MTRSRKVPMQGSIGDHHSLPSSSGQKKSSSLSRARDQLDDSDSFDFELPSQHAFQRSAQRDSGSEGTRRVGSSHQSRNHTESIQPTLSYTHTLIEVASSSDSESEGEVREETAHKVSQHSKSLLHRAHQYAHGEDNHQEQLAAMFPDHPQSTIGTVWELSQGDLQIAADMVLSPPPLTALLQKLKQKIRSERARIVLDKDEIELFHSAVAYYKLPSFDPTLDIRFRFWDQPAVDTGGPHRQTFTSVFAAFAISLDLNLFEQDGRYLRPRYSVQNVMSNLMFILGRMIAHALVLETIGFLHFSCCHYWYIATGDQIQALQYAGLEDVSLHVRELLVQMSQATSEGDLDVVREDVFNHLSNIGSLQLLTDSIAQDILLNEALIKPKPLLDQIAEGLKCLGVLRLIRAFPIAFGPVFMAQGQLTAQVMKKLLVKPTLTEQQEQVWQCLENFLDCCCEEELEDFLVFSTGSNSLVGNRIAVQFSDQPKCHASSCAKHLTIPSHLTDSDRFCITFKAIIKNKGKGPRKGKSFTLV